MIDDVVKTIEQNLWNFLCAEEKLVCDLEKKQPEEIIEKDRRYINLTLCPCIASIKGYYISQGNELFKKKKLSDIQNPDEKILWALFMLREEYLAHDHHHPFQEMGAEKLHDFSILKSGDNLNLKPIDTALKKKVAKFLGFGSAEDLLTHLREQDFPNLTENNYHHHLEEYLTSAIRLNNTIDNLYGLKPSSEQADDVIKGFAITPDLIRDYKTAIIRVRNFALHNYLPILSNEELKESEGTRFLTSILIGWYNFLKRQETEEDRKKGPLGQRLLQEYRAFKALSLSKKNVITPEPDEEYKHCHFEPLPREVIKEAEEYEKERKKEEKKGNFGITYLEKIRGRREFP